MSLKTIQVVCAIIIHNNRVLAAKRSNNMPHPGFWEFPGGKIEEGENAKACLTREIKEELGCDITIGDELPLFPYDYSDKKVILHPFICSLNKGIPKAIEHEKIDWLDWGKLNNINWLPADIPIKDYLAKIK